MATRTRCRTLVAGFGRPGMRDLDLGASSCATSKDEATAMIE
jgi:hypothetical protein